MDAAGAIIGLAAPRYPPRPPVLSMPPKIFSQKDRRPSVLLGGSNAAATQTAANPQPLGGVPIVRTRRTKESTKAGRGRTTGQEQRMPPAHAVDGANAADNNQSGKCQSLRWGPCWDGLAALNRRDAGSIPATAASHTISKPRLRKPSGWMRRLLSNRDGGPALLGGPSGRAPTPRRSSPSALTTQPGLIV